MPREDFARCFPDVTTAAALWNRSRSPRFYQDPSEVSHHRLSAKRVEKTLLEMDEENASAMNPFSGTPTSVKDILSFHSIPWKSTGADSVQS